MENRFQQLEFFQKRIFQRVADFENVFVSQFQMSEELAGVYDGFESVNGRVNGLTNEIQGAFARFYQMIFDRNAKQGSPCNGSQPRP